MVTKIEDRSNLGQGEAGVLGIANEPEPPDRIRLVVTVAIGRSIGCGEEANLLVVANGLRCNTHLPCQFSDLHGIIVALHLLAKWKVRGCPGCPVNGHLRGRRYRQKYNIRRCPREPEDSDVALRWQHRQRLFSPSVDLDFDGSRIATGRD